MTNRTIPDHLVEQAAARMSETDGHLAALLLRRPFLSRLAPPPPHEPASVPRTVPAPVTAATLESAGMIDWTLNRGRLSEEFRVVQGQLLRAMATTTKPPALGNLVMVTSSKPGEGKTFSSLNLAGSLASCSRKAVILVDWDVGRPTLSTILGLAGRPGLLDLQAEPASASGDLLVPTSLPTLRILPAGHRDRQGPMSPGTPVVDVLKQLGSRHADCIIVLDTPSCLSSSDPSRLAPLAGATIMVVQAQQTQTEEVEAALDLVEACPSIMLLLNKLQMTGSDTFGAYD